MLGKVPVNKEKRAGLRSTQEENSVRPFAILMALLTSVLVVSAVACTPDSGGHLAAASPCRPSDSRPSFTLVTYNIHAGVGRDGSRDLKRIAETLHSADVVGLQEVDNGRIRSRFENQVNTLAAMLGHRFWQHFPAEDYWPLGTYGIAATSSLPVVAAGGFDLPVVKGKPIRRLAWISLLVECHPVRVFIIHATRVDDAMTSAQAVQIQAAWRIISREVDVAREPVILLGDFNAHPNAQIIQWLRERMSDVTESQSPQHSVAVPLDYIFLKGGLQVVKVVIKDNGASDHPAVFATLQWTGKPEEGPSLHRDSREVTSALN